MATSIGEPLNGTVDMSFGKETTAAVTTSKFYYYRTKQQDQC